MPSALPTISKPLTFFLNLKSAESWGHHSMGDEVICHKQRFNSVFWFKDWTCQAKYFPVPPSHSVKKYIVTHLLWAFCLAAERSGKNLEPLTEPVVVPVCKINKFIKKEVWVFFQNSFSPKSDQHKFSPDNDHCTSKRKDYEN